MSKLRFVLVAAALVATALVAPALASAQSVPAGGIQQLSDPNDCITVSDTECGTSAPGGLRDAQDLAVTPDGRSVYVVASNEDDEANTGSLTTLSRNTRTGALSYVSCVKDVSSTEPTCPNLHPSLELLRGAIAIVATNEHVYVASEEASTVLAFNRNPTTHALTRDGAVAGEGGCVADTARPGVCTAGEGLAGVDELVMDPLGEFIYALSSSNSTISVIDRNTSDGTITWVPNGCYRGSTSPEVGCGADGSTPVAGLNGVSGADVSEDNNDLYTVSPTASALTVFDRNTTTGLLTFRECHRGTTAASDPATATCGAPRGGLNGAIDVEEVTAGGTQSSVYTIGQQTGPGGALGSAIAEFDRTQSTGALTYQDCSRDNESNEPDPASTSGFCDSERGFEDGTSIVARPNGEQLYVTAEGDDSVAVLTRSKTTGDIDQTNTPEHACLYEDPEGEATDECGTDVDGITDVRESFVTPDGAFLYTVSPTDDAVAAFIVQSAPTCTGLTVSTPQNQPIEIPLDPLCTDPNTADDPQLRYELVEPPENGTAVIVNRPDTAQPYVRYTPNTGTSGTDNFTFRAIDPAGNASAPAEIVVNVSAASTTPIVSINDVQVNESAGTAQFTVTRTNSTAEVVVTYSTANGTATAPADYTSRTNQTITFPAGSTASQTITVPIVNDTAVELNETFSVILTNATGGAVFGDSSGIATIVDDDPPAVSVSDAAVVEGQADMRDVVFTVTLSAPKSHSVSVNYSTENITAIAGSDYDGRSGTLTFAPGETTKTVAVPVRGDTEVEPDEAFRLALSGPSNAVIGDGEGIGTIQNDDQARPPQPPPATSMVIADSGISEGDSGRRNLVFTVALSRAATAPVTVNFATAGGNATPGTDYVATRGSLTWAVGETTKEIVVPVIGDTRFEADEQFGVALSGATGAEIVKSVGLGTIANDDIRRLLPRIEVAVTPVRDRELPFRFVVSGRIIRPAGVTAAQGCTGIVNVQYKAGGNTISNRRTPVNRACRFSRRTTFRNPRRLRNRNGRLTVIVRFQGNEYLLRRTAPRMLVRAG